MNVQPTNACLESPSDHLDSVTSDGPIVVRTPEQFNLGDPDATVAGRVARAKPKDSNGAAGSSSSGRTRSALDLQVGTEVLGFRLLCELGRGAFGRVFLARQGDLADREVVIKVSPSVDAESRLLARLQHSNIVPIYSVHRDGSLQAVCMPYFGATTLAHVMKELTESPSLPQSGEALLRTVRARRSTVVDPAVTAPERAPMPPAEVLPALAGTKGPVEVLPAMSYADTILWLGARLADGLAHAHERGIVHRDLKPANVLLTDDGNPMLLDFNLSQDTRNDSAETAHVGGTLPYMAPEQLEAYLREAPLLSPAGDIYSLGVILYELLTKRYPFTGQAGSSAELIAGMIQERRQPPPSLRRFNRAVTPAVEAIVRHCLEPDPARRYQSARQLKEDLERQLENQPLQHIPDPSLRERAGKWMRRHPRVASLTTLMVTSTALLFGVLGLAYARGERLANLEAKAEVTRLLEDRNAVRYLLAGRTGDAAQVEAGVEAARGLLGRYGVLDRADWRQAAAVRRLSAADRESLDESVEELLLLLAGGLTLQAAGQPDDARAEGLAVALRLNERAEADAGGRASRALLLQRAEIRRLLGSADESKRLRERAEAAPLKSATGYYLAAADLIAKGRTQRAVSLLMEAVEHDPQAFWCWFLLGVCYDGRGQMVEAVACYDTCLAIAPASPWAYFNRGLARLRLGRAESAVADFDRAIALQPSMSEAHVHRALAHVALKKYDEAIRGLDAALEQGAPDAYVRFLRADARERKGDRDGAKKDREEAMRREPTDEKGWQVRAFARLNSDPRGALADIDRALRINPRSLTALQNKAHVLSKLGQNKEAAAALDRALEWYPDSVKARAGRAVLRARLGRRAEAHDDVVECMARDRSPLTVYQLAGVYALTSRAENDDRKQAFRLLTSALERGCGFDLLESDRDLDPIRDLPEFKKLVEACRAIRPAPAGRADKL
jgi:serine/threonine protein kinase/Tfp pilus assembly protein PilF